MNPTQSRTEQYWLSAFLVIPMLCAKAFGEAYTADKGMQILYSALTGGLGGMLGFAVYYFTRKRPSLLRAAVLLALIGLIIVPTILLTKAENVVNTKTNASHSTCPVCGYIAFNAQEQTCDNCGEELTENELRESGFSSVDSLVRLGQIYHFIPDDEKAAVSFEQPAISEDGYRLDESWEPSVSKAEVDKQAIEYYGFRRKYPIKVKVIKKE